MQKIPKIIHYVWVGPRPLPDADRRRVDTWRSLLPGWTFKFWNNDTIDYSSLYLRSAFATRAWNRVSDYTRMDALYRMGGIYLDTDVDLLRSFEPLLGNGGFAGFQAGDERRDEMVNGAVLASVPGHWLPGTVRAYFNQRLEGWMDIGGFAGPGLITQVLRERGLHGYCESGTRIDDFMVYPRRYFYPYSWTEAYSDDIVTPDTYAVHRWAESWLGKRTLPVRMRRLAVKSMARYTPELAFRLTRSLTSLATSEA